MEEVKMLEVQLKCLQDEVALLQCQQQEKLNDRTFDFCGQIWNTLLWSVREKQSDIGVLANLREEVEKLEEDLRLQTQMNGITLKSSIINNLENTDSKVVQQLQISGCCSTLDFQVQFHLSEVKEVPRPERSISCLTIAMDDRNMQRLGNFLSGVEQSGDLLLFFRTLRTFCDRCDDRRKTFQHLQAKYSSVVSLPGGCRSEVMALQHPELPGCIFFVNWLVEVSREGEVTAKIDLLTKIPERALEIVPSEALRGNAESFHSLLRLLGPEAALESIIRAISLSLHV